VVEEFRNSAADRLFVGVNKPKLQNRKKLGLQYAIKLKVCLRLCF